MSAIAQSIAVDIELPVLYLLFKKCELDFKTLFGNAWDELGIIFGIRHDCIDEMKNISAKIDQLKSLTVRVYDSCVDDRARDLVKANHLDQCQKLYSEYKSTFMVAHELPLHPPAWVEYKKNVDDIKTTLDSIQKKIREDQTRQLEHLHVMVSELLEFISDRDRELRMDAPAIVVEPDCKVCQAILATQPM